MRAPPTSPLPTGRRLVAVMSDIELGPGGPTDDVPDATYLAERLADLPRRHPGRALAVVFNGDTFDFLKTPVDGHFPTHVTAGRAVTKVQRIARAHPEVFEALRSLTAGRDAPCRVYFVTGNHDAELAFPEVQDALRQLCGGDPERVLFPGLELDLGEVRIEHGSQGDPMFRVDPRRPFVEADGQRLLALPFGTVGLLEVALPYHRWLHPLDRVKPRSRLFEIMPELREFIVGRAWAYWSRGFWRSYLGHRDPVKHFDLGVAREVAYRFVTQNPELSIDGYYRRAARTGPHRAVVVGHQHQVNVHTVGPRRVLRTGALRHEFHLFEAGRLRPVPKVYAELRMDGPALEGARFVTVDAAPPPDWMPESVFDLSEVVHRLLRDSGQGRHPLGAPA